MARSSQKAAQAITLMKESAPDKSLDLHFLQVDLQNFASVVQVVEQFKTKESNLDILINNAGVSSPSRQK